MLLQNCTRQKAEEAVSDVIGVMTTSADAAYSSFNDGMNPYYRVAFSWNEIRVSANITSYLGGYDDPRLSAYVNDAQLDGAGRAGYAMVFTKAMLLSGLNMQLSPSQYRRN